MVMQSSAQWESCRGAPLESVRCHVHMEVFDISLRFEQLRALGRYKRKLTVVD